MTRGGHGSKERGVEGGEDSLIDEVIDGRYSVKGTLGAGGVGVVYRAEHVRLRRDVAVKVLQREYAARLPLRRRFEREARAMAALDHPNIVKITDFGVWRDLPFLVMELLEGRTLKDRLCDTRLGADEVLDIAGQILRAVAFAHEKGLVHRDLKPGNIFLTERSGAFASVSILDFGLAKFVTGGDGPEGTPKLTVTGVAFGTPAYMAPEQAAGGQTDHRTDLYSIGVMLFEQTTGSLPFRGEMGEMMRQHIFTPPPRLAEFFRDRVPSREVGPGLEAFFEKVLAKERSKRFQGALEMLDALEAQAGALRDLIGDQATDDATDPTSLARQEGPTPPTVADDERRTAVTAQEIPSSERGEGLAFATTEPAEGGLAAPEHPAGAGRRVKTVAVIAGVVVAIGVGLWLIWWGHGEVSTAAPAAGPTSPPTSASEPPFSPSSSSSSPPADPSSAPRPLASSGERHRPSTIWDDPMPPLVAGAKSQLDSGGQLDEGTARQLLSFAWRNKGDARPLLLLARYRLGRGHLTDAVDRYEKAYQADPRAKTDLLMLPHLIGLAKSRTVGWRAARAVKEIYGSTALPAVEEALDDPDLDAPSERRLRQLKQELAAMAP